MIKEGWNLERAPYWGLFLIIVVVSVIADMSYDPYARNNDIYIFLDMILVASFGAITYGRVKDIGWHGAWTIACIIPLFNIVIGCIKSKETAHVEQ